MLIVSQPSSISDWLDVAAQHEAAADLLYRHQIVAGQAIFHTGLAIECLLKASIMARGGLRVWPSRSKRPDLWSHNLIYLLQAAGLTMLPTDPVAPAWLIVSQWDRGQGYDPKPMPLGAAREMVDAAFGRDGVAPWLRS